MNKQSINPILYVTDDFLSIYKAEFNTKYLELYKNERIEELKEIFDSNKSKVIIKSADTFSYRPLKPEETKDDLLDNIITLFETLKNLTTMEARSEKLWIALSNTYYLEYHISQINKGKDDQAKKSRAHFTSSAKRSLMLTNLSLLWWLGHYTYDESNSENPYHYTQFLIKNSSKGDWIGFFSSNIISNRTILFGILDALEELQENEKLKLNRYAFTNSNKILNQIGGTKILDILTQEEIKDIILNNLLNTENLVYKKD